MSKRIKRVIIAVVLALVLSLSFSILPVNTTRKFDINEYGYGANFFVELENVPVYTQQAGHTCFAVSSAIARTFLGLETSENELIAEFGLQDRSVGMLPREYLPFAQEAFRACSYSVKLYNPGSETEILNMITGSLTDGLPVIFYYSVMDDWNKPSYNTHYGVLYGVDVKKRIVKLSNPYGYLDEMSFTDFFEGLAFENYKNEPYMHRLGRVIGYIKSNNLFLLEHTG